MEHKNKIQNVNLYLPELQVKQEWLSSRTLLILVVGLLGVLTVSGLLSVRQISEFEAVVSDLERQALVSQKRVADIKARVPAGNAIKLDNIIAQLRVKIATRIAITDLIEGQSLGNDLGYSERMYQLGYAVDSKTEIQRLRFSRGANYVEILGESKNPASAAELAEKLKDFPSYEFVNFGELSITEKKENRGLYIFSYGFDSLYDFNSDRSRSQN